MAASFVRYKSRTCPHLLRFLLGKSRKAKTLPVSWNAVSQAPATPSPVYVLARSFASPAGSSDSPIKAQSTEKEPLSTSDQLEKLSKEQYIPITRQSVIRHLIQEQDFLTDAEKKIFPDFALALDSALVNKYHGVLQELKALFDPINPDKETMQTREWSRREKLDNEFWLLQQLDDVMEKANFVELEKDKVHRMLQEHDSTERVKVSVDPSRYDVLRFWVLGYETPELNLSLTERLVNKVLKRPPRKAVQYFKRVVVAIRLKKDSKLFLKAFKEVPVDSIEMLLPDGTIKMSTLDKGVLVTSGGIAAFGILAKLVTVLANITVDWTLVMTALTGMITFRVWSTYKNRRNAYLVEVSRVLYFKNIANNRGLLTLLVDRAEDESFKEALLTYAFLLNSKPAEFRKNPNSFRLAPKVGLTESEIKKVVEEWVEQKTGVILDFDTLEAVRVLKELGLLSAKGNVYEVVPLEVANRLLPQVPQSVIARRNTEADIAEGYDRDEYLETEEEYKAEDARARRYGWF